MATIIRQLPVDEARAVVFAGQQALSVLPFQAIVWVSVTSVRLGTIEPGTPRLPAAIDLGFNGTFAIREEQLADWTQQSAEVFPFRRSTQLRGASCDQRLARLWLYRNVPRQRAAAVRQPFRLDLHQGLFVMRKPAPGQFDNRPRLPLIGFRALRDAGLRVVVDCKRCHLSVQTAPRFILF